MGLTDKDLIARAEACRWPVPSDPEFEQLMSDTRLRISRVFPDAGESLSYSALHRRFVFSVRQACTASAHSQDTLNKSGITKTDGHISLHFSLCPFSPLGPQLDEIKVFLADRSTSWSRRRA